jgi:leader peptidase (prepilin peptidase)/N-methyltransferase
VNPILLLLIGAGFGAIIGSFLATIVSRWPRGASVVTGRSRCDGCGRALGIVDLVPLLGWLVARGKCRACGARIDPVHPLIELGCALIGGFCAWAFPPLPTLLFAGGGWLLLTLAVLDARHLWLPDALTLPLAGLGLTLGDWVLPAPFPDRLIGAVAGAGLLALLALAYRHLRGRDGLGLGDAKLLGAIGAWLGWQALPFVLLIGSAAALLWLLIQRLRGKALDAQTRVPLGTFLCLAVVPAWAIALSLSA